MSGKVTGGGGLGNFLQKLMMPSAPAAEAPSGETKQASLGGDVLSLGGAGGASRLTLTANEATAVPSAKTQVASAGDLSELINNLTRQEFPGLKLSPRQAAGMASFIRNELEARGINDSSFQDLKNRLA